MQYGVIFASSHQVGRTVGIVCSDSDYIETKPQNISKNI